MPQCAPSAEYFWLIGSHHKTGTELMDAMLTVATGVHYCSSAGCKDQRITD